MEACSAEASRRTPVEPDRTVRVTSERVLSAPELARFVLFTGVLWIALGYAAVSWFRLGAWNTAPGVMSIITLLAAAMLLTQLWFPYRYWQLALGFAALPSWLVLARDLVLVALLAVLDWPDRAVEATQEAAAHRT